MPGSGSELFISDLHLSAHEPATVAHFLQFLEGPARQAARLTILGDLFDYWPGDDDLADPFNSRIATALHALADHGVAIDLMVGNRDFLIGNTFAATAGVTLLLDPTVREIGGIKTLLTHGDTLCTDDADYQRFRAQVRSPEWQAQFLARPLAERKREIETLRARSEAEKRSKPQEIMDANANAVVAALCRHQADAMIHGHTHRQGCHTHGTGTRWVLGDWHADKASVLACAANGWRWLAAD
ncbi:MAG: UDP-2,3-diacylglucosamine diphosphatase [Rhodocyclaceae bacterium]|nr:UDP-2,3-diacylglucosamine diphosphatase [Rhodocyclaceae bacterium]MDZ4215609.1 UDP-2,3-diacylglucosamine diphosphatase [Rhodocyclaceae bacterium]